MLLRAESTGAADGEGLRVLGLLNVVQDKQHPPAPQRRVHPGRGSADVSVASRSSAPRARPQLASTESGLGFDPTEAHRTPPGNASLNPSATAAATAVLPEPGRPRTRRSSSSYAWR